MTDTKKRHSAAFKARVALEAAKQTRTLAELSGTFQVHSVQISKWKKQTAGRHRIAVPRRPPPRPRREPGDPGRALRADRPALMEVEWLKKKSARFG